MSTNSLGPNIITSNLAFNLDPSVSSGFIKTPRQLSGCITWFDADDLSTITTETNSRNVRYWADKSVSNLLLTGGGLSLSNEPLSVLGGLNGRNTIRCDGGDYLSCPFTTTYTEFTIFYVLKGDESYNSRNHILSINNGSFSSGNNNFELNVNDNYGSAYQTMWVYWNGGGSPSSVIGLTSPNTKSDFLQGSPTLFTFSHTNAGSGTNTIYVNGRTRSDQVNSSTQTITIGGGSHTLYLGVQVPVSLPFKGDICEVIIYSRQLSTTERTQVHNYLANKWRIPLFQATSTNRDLIFNKLMTCQNNNIPVIDKSYRLNPANSSGSPLQSNFYLTDVSYMSSVISNTITLEAWVKPNSFTFAGNNTDLGSIMIANSNFYLSLDGNGKFNAYLQGSGGAFGSHQPSTTSVTRHAWNHVVWTYDGAYIRWYLNGVLDKTSSSTFTLGTLTLTQNLGIGSEGSVGYGRMLDGYVAGCKIYGKALTSSEVRQNYEQTKTEFSTLPNITTTNLHFYLDADVYSSYIGTGTSWNDLSGNGYNSTLTGGPTFISTEPKSFNFNGNYALLPTNTANGYNGDALTVEVWVRHNTFGGVGTGRSYVSNWSSFNVNNQRGFILRTYDTQTYPSFWWCWGGANYYAEGPSSYVMQTGKIYHIVATYEKNVAMKIYINGNLELTTTNYTGNTILFDTSNGTHIGYSPINTSYMDGNIYLARVYNRALSDVEVLQNYNATKFRFGK